MLMNHGTKNIVAHRFSFHSPHHLPFLYLSKKLRPIVCPLPEQKKIMRERIFPYGMRIFFRYRRFIFLYYESSAVVIQLKIDLPFLFQFSFQLVCKKIYAWFIVPFFVPGKSLKSFVTIVSFNPFFAATIFSSLYCLLRNFLFYLHQHRKKTYLCVFLWWRTSKMYAHIYLAFLIVDWTAFIPPKCRRQLSRIKDVDYFTVFLLLLSLYFFLFKKNIS